MNEWFFEYVDALEKIADDLEKTGDALWGVDSPDPGGEENEKRF